MVITSKPYQWSLWKDKRGRVRWGDKALNEIKNAREVFISRVFHYYGKAILLIGKWSEAKPLGHELEIIPITDLSQVKTGDEVTFKVLFVN